MRRLAGAVAGAALAVVPATAGAASFRSCSAGVPVQCVTLTVPLDRTGAVPGTTPLYVVRVRARHPRRPPLVLVTGGPGQAGADLIAGAGPGGPFDPDRLRRDVIAFDPRGTGHSGLLRCPPLEKAKSFLATDAAAACWGSLGARRYGYTSRTVADDIDAIRQKVRAPKIALYGISYGTSVAQTYARVYPQNVDRVILDSTVDPGGGDMLYRPTFTATSRVLDALCAPSRCRSFTADPVGDLAALIRALPAAGLAAQVVGSDGRSHPLTIRRFELVDLLIDGDFTPEFRGGFPAAVHSALAGDPAALARLVRQALDSDAADFIHPHDLSIADYAATVCQEGPFPWARTGTADERAAQAAAAVAAIPPASLFPWDQASALASDFLATCLKWPATAQAPDLGTAYPDVPVLVLSGEGDLRTPLEGAKAVAARYPHAILRTFPHAGHDVVDGAAGDPCAWDDLRSFLAGRAVGTCVGGAPAPRIAKVAPASLAAVSGSGQLRRVLHAVALTLGDLSDQSGLSAGAIPGLRAGRAIAGAGGLRLRHFTYVPGIELTGTIRGGRADLRISGAVRGRFRLRGRRVSLTVGGHRLSASASIARAPKL
ncbi:MAG: alpha/beta hydrolase [Solirubrobacterales bacterium]|nr:alpha/beta hydrolase [Solirubrobacterales bacterium]